MVATLEELEDDLIADITVDQIFRSGERLVWPVEKTGTFYWRSIKIEFRGFVVGKGDENPDEPEFLVTYQVTPGGTGYLRYPTGILEPPSVPDEVAQNILQPILEFGLLDDRRSHRVVLICAAIDSDSDSLWEQVLSAFDSDVRATLGTAMTTLSVPAAFAGFASTPRALMNFFLSKLGSLLTDNPEAIGEKTLVDWDTVWRRKPSDTKWTALKILRHQVRGRDAWYLTLWRIELDAGPFPETRTALPPPPEDGGPGGQGDPPAGGNTEELPREVGMNLDQPVSPLHAALAVSQDARFAGVLRVLQGESAKSVAKDYGMDAAELKRGRDLMLSGGVAAFEAFLRQGALGELKALRAEIEKLKKSQK